jgi:hypothetical protein
MSTSLIRRTLIVISGLTMISGAVQALAPRRLLRTLMAEDDATARHLFGTIGMFMFVVGGGLLNALVRPGRDPVIVFWAALQKVAAFVAVALGVRRRIFSPIALGIAFFDLLSGLLAAEYWRRIR